MGFISSKKVKTRKEHICFGCQNNIPKGETAIRNTQTDGGEIYSLYFCETCSQYCGKCRDCFDYESAGEGYIAECKREREED